MRTAIKGGLLLAGAFLLAGCANVCVKKVPVADRIAGTDRQHGFRYYLTRPYVVVKERVPLATVVIAANLESVTIPGRAEPGYGLVARGFPPGRGCRPIYDLSGIEQPGWKL